MSKSLESQQQNREAVLPLSRPTKFVLVTCRALTSDETSVLSKNFKQILVYNAALSSGNTDIGTLAFDLLIVEANAANHTFLEIIAPSTKKLQIPLIVLKLKFSNYKALATDLGATVITRVEDIASFGDFLSKTRVTKLEHRLLTFFKKLFQYALARL